MRNLPAAVLTALAERAIICRTLFWVTAKDRDTGDPASLGLWTDVGFVSIDVTNPYTGLVESRDFHGNNSALSIDDIPMTSDLTVREIMLHLSHLNDNVAQLIRGYDARRAPVEVFWALFNKNFVLQHSAFPIFVGRIDDAPIKEPREGELGEVAVRCVSQIAELLRTNPTVFSDASQKLRSATDTGGKYANVVADWEQFWGMKRGRVVKGGRKKREKVT